MYALFLPYIRPGLPLILSEAGPSPNLEFHADHAQVASSAKRQQQHTTLVGEQTTIRVTPLKLSMLGGVGVDGQSDLESSIAMAESSEVGEPTRKIRAILAFLFCGGRHPGVRCSCVLICVSKLPRRVGVGGD